MELFRGQFTIRGLMISVCVVAGLLAIPDPWNLFAFMFAVQALVLIGTGRIFLRYRRLSAIGFAVLTGSVNALCIGSCIVFPDSYFLALLVALWICTVPVTAGLGAAWVTSATRSSAPPQRKFWAAWVVVIALAIMPLVTLYTLWPLRLAFLMARPELERLADGVANNQAVSASRWAGTFRVVASDFDTATGNVALITNANPGGRSGFVRARKTSFGPLHGLNLNVDLGWGWWYQEED